MYLGKAIIRAGGVDVKGMVVFLRRVDMSAKEFEGKIVAPAKIALVDKNSFLSIIKFIYFTQSRFI